MYNYINDFSGIVGRISPRTWAAMEVFLASFATEDYDAMASALSEMGATGNDINFDEFAKDLRKIFSSIQVIFPNDSRLFDILKT